MTQPTNPTDLPIMTGLTALQADGLVCVRCGKPTMYSGRTFTPVGRSNTGSQVFACSLGFACVPATLDTAPAPVADPADTVRPGDPDPTPGSGADCPAEHNGLLCTREAGHTGQHVAGDFHKKVAGVWPNEAELDAVADAAHDEWAADRASEDATPTVHRHRGTIIVEYEGEPVLRLDDRQATELTVLLAAATGYTPPAEPVPADQEHAHEHLVISEAIGRLAAQLDARVIRICRTALASGQPANAAAALDALVEAGDEWYADGHDLDDIRADADTVSAALRRIAGWKSL